MRILAATNRNLEREVAAGRFRADLYWRLNVIPIELPALRERADRHRAPGRALPARAPTSATGARSPGFDPQALAALEAYHWPGNIRELENVIERLVIVKGSGTLASPTCRRAIRTPARRRRRRATPMPELPEDGTDLRAMLEAVEDRMIGEALERTGGNKNRAAELLGLNRTTLVEKLRRKRVAQRGRACPPAGPRRGRGAGAPSGPLRAGKPA